MPGAPKIPSQAAPQSPIKRGSHFLPPQRSLFLLPFPLSGETIESTDDGWAQGGTMCQLFWSQGRTQKQIGLQSHTEQFDESLRKTKRFVRELYVSSGKVSREELNELLDKR